MQRCEDNVAARLNGNALQPLSDVSVTVTDDHTGLPAALYSDNGVTQVFQPLKTDDNGYYGFYAANGEYTLTFSGIRIATFTRKVVLNDFDDNPAVTKAELAAGSGASLVTFMQSGSGAAPTTVQAALRAIVRPEQFGADPSGVADSSAAFAAALVASNCIEGTPGATYLIGSEVDLTGGKTLIGNGATLKGAANVICFRLTGDSNQVKGWNIAANGALYMFLDQGLHNAITANTFRGNVGHYVFGAGAKYLRAEANTFDGEGVSRIGTSIVFEDCFAPSACNNLFTDIENWCIQVRGATTRFKTNDNTCSATEYTATLTATAGQTVFPFVLTNACHLAGVQVGGVPVDAGITIFPAIPAATPTKNITVTFAAGRTVGDVVKLIAHRAAENIQINGTATDGTINGNVCAGGGDSGILLAGSCKRVTVNGNMIRDIAYAGVSMEGGVSENTVSNNSISGCSLVTNTATYSSGILVGGGSNCINGNVISNTRGTMKYGISLNTYSADDGTPNKSVKIGQNTYVGTFVQKVMMPNEDASQRRSSVQLQDGITAPYPERVDLDSAWTNVPPSTNYWSMSGFGGTGAIRDTSVKLGGVASLKTVAGEYIDMVPTARGALLNCVVTINFRAKNNSGSSYLTAFLNIGGSLIGSPSVTVTDTAWRWYSLTFPITNSIDPAAFSLRVGGNTGNANFQEISMMITRL